jgi:hypothetical protein
MEARAFRLSGFLMFGVQVLLVVIAVVAVAVLGDRGEAEGLLIVIITIVGVAAIAISTGFTIISPNQARVLQSSAGTPAPSRCPAFTGLFHSP